VILINGEKQEAIAATDRGLHYGDGLFETVAVKCGRPQLWSAHMSRLTRGCERLGIPVPDSSLLLSEAEQVCSDASHAVLKIIITRGSGGRGYRLPSPVQPTRIVSSSPWPAHAAGDAPVRLRFCRTPLGCNPVLAGLKHLNRLEQVMARAEWDDEAITDGVMCDLQGNVIEGTMSNIFCVRGGTLVTPSLEQCGVEGVMRETVLQMADKLNIPCEVRQLSRDELLSMDEVFITNSVIALRAVAAIEGVNYGDNPVTGQLQEAVCELLEAQ